MHLWSQPRSTAKGWRATARLGPGSLANSAVARSWRQTTWRRSSRIGDRLLRTDRPLTLRTSCWPASRAAAYDLPDNHAHSSHRQAVQETLPGELACFLVAFIVGSIAHH